MEIQEYKTGKGFGIRLEARLKNADLVKARERLGLNIKQAAERIGIHYISLGKFENLKGYPSQETQKKICGFYRQKGALMSKENVFPEWLRYVQPKKLIAEKEIPKDKIISLSYIDRKLLPVYDNHIREELDKRIILEKLLNTLTEREIKILTLRFGLNGENPLSLKEVEEKFGVTRERIRQIESQTLKKLRYRAESEGLREFILR